VAGTATHTVLVVDSDAAAAVFPGVRPAVAAAVDILRKAGSAATRAAIAIGESSIEDLPTSPAVVEAVALFDAAKVGELVLSPTATAVLGDHRYRIHRRPDGSATIEWREPKVMTPLPLFLASGERLVGRATELAQAVEVIAQVASGSPRRLVLRGEAGIGKTALAGAIAVAAREQGFTVLAGRSSEEPALPYQPLAEALRPVVDALGLEELATRVGSTAPFLAAMFPSLGPVPRGGAADEARELLRHALAATILSVAESGPTLLLLDDIQWAPRATVDLLNDLFADLAVPLLLVATLRDGEVADGKIDEELRAWIAEAATTTTIALGALSLGDTAALVALHSDRLSHEVGAVADIHRRSAGNAFFVEELALHMGESPTGGETPESLREVVLRRVDAIGPSAASLLAVGAVVGAPFDAALLAHVADEPEELVEDVLTAATRSSLLVSIESGFDFKHALTRDALYGSVSAARRRVTHRRVAESLDGPADLVAYHVAAGATAETLNAVAPAALAACDAVGPRWANDVRPVLRHALEALALDSRPRRDRATLLWRLSQAAFDAGDRDEVWQTAERAALEARTVGDIRLFAHAVSDMGPRLPNAGPFDRFQALVEDALQLAGDDDEALTLAATALASYLAWRGNDIARATQLSERGLTSAARLGDPELVAHALSIRAEVLSGTSRIDERLRVAERYVATMEQAGASPLGEGFAEWAGALLSAGRRDEFDDACDAASRIVAERPWWYTEELLVLLRACRTLLDGELTRTMVDIAPRLGGFSDEGISPFAAQAALVWREIGRTADLIPIISAIPRAESTSRIVPTLLMLAKAELGDLDGARVLLDDVADDDFAQLFTSFASGVALAMTATACWHLRDTERATRLAHHLRPYGGQMIVIPPSTAVFGAGDYFLGLLAETYGDRAAALNRLESALALDRRVRAPLLAGHTAVALARVVRDDDPARADQLLDEAQSTADRLNAARLTAAVASLHQAEAGGGE
jgi:hypothetical protein